MIEFTGKNEYYPAVFALSKAALFGGELRKEDFSRVDFSLLYKVCNLHAIIPELAEVIPRVCTDEKADAIWENRIFSEVKRYLLLLAEASAVVELLRKEEIPAVIIKGFSAACYYPRPELRQEGDVDVFVPGELFDKSYGILEKNGYRDEKDISPRHVHFDKDGVSVELHRRFSEENVPEEKGRYIEETIQKGIRNAVPYTVEDKTLYRLPDEENGLVLLQHLCQHFKTGVGLRHLTDWMMFADRVLDNEFWEKRFREMADRAGVAEFAKVMTKICVRYLGLPEKGHEWCEEADDTLTDEALTYILTAGNMGMGRDYVQKKTIIGLQDKRNIFVRFHTSGLNHWKAAQKYKILRPFAFFYQCFHVINWLFFKRKGGLKAVQAGVKESKRSQVLFDKLNI